MAGVRMHEDEFEVDADLVSRLLTRQFPQWADLPLEPVASAGTDNALFRLGDQMVVRLPRIQWAVEGVDLEQEWLPRLAPFLPVAIPTPLGLGESDEDYPWRWSVYEWLGGDNPVLHKIADPIALAKDLAHFTKALRKIDSSGAPLSQRGVPLQERDADTRTAIAALNGLIDSIAVGNAWESTLAVPMWSGPPVWIHGDISPGNILLVDGRLNSVIDFGVMGIGDPACDLIVAWNLLPASAREVFRSESQVDDFTWKRGRGWALSIALIQLPYYFQTSPAIAENARHVISEVLSDTLSTEPT